MKTNPPPPIHPQANLPPPPAASQPCGLATWSMVCGIAGLVTCLFFVEPSSDVYRVLLWVIYGGGIVMITEMMCNDLLLLREQAKSGPCD